MGTLEMTGSQSGREGLRIAADHGIKSSRLLAYEGLARSRGVALDEVLRGDLREVVLLPAHAGPLAGPA